MIKKLDPIHPGEILREEFLLPMHITPNKLAKSIDVPASRIDQIIKERRSVSADTALRLSVFFRTTPELWTNLQAKYDLQHAEEEMLDSLRKIIPYAA
jgi:antitoxin HigA-1